MHLSCNPRLTRFIVPLVIGMALAITPLAHADDSTNRPAATVPANPAATPANSGKEPANQAAPRVDCYGDPLPPGAIARLGTIRLRNQHRVNDVAFTPDGKELVSVGGEKSIRFWDVETGKPTRRLVSDDQTGILAIAISPDGGRMASVGEPGMICMWNLRTSRIEWGVLGHPQDDHRAHDFSIAYSPDGSKIATCGPEKLIRVWNATNGAKLMELPSERTASPVAFSPDGKRLAYGEGRSTIRIQNLDDGSELIVIPHAHENTVVSLAFTKTGSLLSSGSHEEPEVEPCVSEIRSWHVSSGEKQADFETKEKLRGHCTIALSPDGRHLVSEHVEKIAIWDVASRKLVRTFRAQGWPRGDSHGLAISPGSKLVAARPDYLNDNKVCLWKLETGEPVLPQSDCHTSSVLAIDVSPDGSQLITGSDDGTVRLRNATTFELVRLLDRGSGQVRFVEFFPNGELVAIGRRTYKPGIAAFSGELKICRVVDGEVIHHLPLPEVVYCGALSPSGDLLAVGVGFLKQCQIYVWNTESGMLVSEITVPPMSPCIQLQFTADGRQLWSLSLDHIVRKWNAVDGKEIELHRLVPGKFQSHGGLSYMIPDRGRVLVGVSEKVGKVTQRSRLAAKYFSDSKVQWESAWDDKWPSKFAMSSDESLIAVILHPLSRSTARHPISVLSAADGRKLQSFDLDDDEPHSLAFSHDNQRLLTGMEMGDTLIWDISAAAKAVAQETK